MFIPQTEDLEKIWDVAPEGFKPRITSTSERMPLAKGADARKEDKLNQAIVGETPIVYIVDWVDEDGNSWGVMVAEIRDEEYDSLVIHDLWLQQPLQGIGLTHELIRKGYLYWRERIDYWVVPQWNDESRPVFEHIGFRESDLFPGKYGPTSLVADLKGEDSPVAQWYAVQEPSEADPTGK